MICTQQVEYVGHLLTSEGLRPSPDRIKALTEMSAPQKRAEPRDFPRYVVMNFISVSGYIRYTQDSDSDNRIEFD